MIIERLSVKEFLIYLKKCESNTGVLEFINRIEPLEYDSTMINDFVSELVKGKVDDSLIGFTEALYEDIDLKSLKERKALVDLLGNRNMFFDDEE